LHAAGAHIDSHLGDTDTLAPLTRRVDPLGQLARAVADMAGRLAH
jgi:hypothetical protein